MTQQDVAAAVGRLEAVANILERPESDMSARLDANVAVQHAADLRLILDALQQRSGDERERVARFLHGRFQQPPGGFSWDRLSDWGRENWLAEADLVLAILGGQSCP